MRAAGSAHRGRVEHADPGPQAADGDGHVESWRVPDVVGVGLEGHTEHGHRPAGEGATGQLAGQLHHPGAAAGVDRVHFSEEA